MSRSVTPHPSIPTNANGRLLEMWRIARDQCGVTDTVLSNYTSIPEGTLRSWRCRGLSSDVPWWFADALIQCAGHDADRLLNVLARPLGHEVAVRPEPSESGMQALTGKLAGDAGHAVQVLLSAFADGHVDAGELQAISESLRTLDEDVEQLKADTSLRVAR